jgi:hypothetical protein
MWWCTVLLEPQVCKSCQQMLSRMGIRSVWMFAAFADMLHLSHCCLRSADQLHYCWGKIHFITENDPVKNVALLSDPLAELHSVVCIITTQFLNQFCRPVSLVNFFGLFWRWTNTICVLVLSVELFGWPLCKQSFPFIWSNNYSCSDFLLSRKPIWACVIKSNSNWLIWMPAFHALKLTASSYLFL